MANMTSRTRFIETLNFGHPDRVPYFEEGIRKEVLKNWYKQGLSKKANLAQMFPIDHREEIAPDLDPRPFPKQWPKRHEDLNELRKKLDPFDHSRLPRFWKRHLKKWHKRNHVLMLRVHRGFFLSMGVYDLSRFNQVIYLIRDDPEFIHQYLQIQGNFAARIVDNILREVDIDAAFFSEPIGGNDRPLLSPQMYEEFVLSSYKPLLDVLHKHNVKTIILLTYANFRVLIPSILKCGINTLWACETNAKEMDYRELRRQYGRDLRLIGGIDLDTLRKDKEAIRREIEEKVPTLIADGGYIPLADGRVREDVPFENYAFYRELLHKVTQV
jgi:uroporphyrinogen decarboxylase